MGYENVNLPTPEIFEGTKPNSSALIISSGHSTKDILNLKEQIRKKFDVIIACNRAFENFDDIIDFHLVTEKTTNKGGNIVNQILMNGNFSTAIPRIINWKGIDLYPNRYNLIKATRSNFGFNPNIRKYKYNNTEGMLIGPLGKQNFSLGSVTLSAMHFTTMLGSSKIFLIGADMCFKDQFDHFYKDRVYRDTPITTKQANSHKIVNVKVGENNYTTTEFFEESAKYINKMAETIFKDIEITDFSDGLISSVKKIKINDYLNVGKLAKI